MKKILTSLLLGLCISTSGVYATDSWVFTSSGYHTAPSQVETIPPSQYSNTNYTQQVQAPQYTNVNYVQPVQSSQYTNPPVQYVNTNVQKPVITQPQYQSTSSYSDPKLQKQMLKNQKSVQNKVLNAQIKNHMDQITAITNDMTMPMDEKSRQIQYHQNQILELKNQKSLNNYNYKKAKDNI